MVKCYRKLYKQLSYLKAIKSDNYEDSNKEKKQRTNTSKELEEINNNNLYGKLRKLQTFL